MQELARRVALEAAAAVVAYYAFFVVGPQLADSTSELRLALAELRASYGDTLAGIRDGVAMARQAFELDNLPTVQEASK